MEKLAEDVKLGTEGRSAKMAEGKRALTWLPYWWVITGFKGLCGHKIKFCEDVGYGSTLNYPARRYS